MIEYVDFSVHKFLKKVTPCEYIFSDFHNLIYNKYYFFSIIMNKNITATDSCEQSYPVMQFSPGTCQELEACDASGRLQFSAAGFSG